MIVVVAGMKRSGSTLLMNIIRLILEESYRVYPRESNYQPRNIDDVDLVKIHPYRPELAKAADYIFTSSRNIKEVHSSWERFYGEPLEDPLYSKWNMWLRCWDKHADYHAVYPDIRDHTNHFIGVIARVLNTECNVKRVQEDIATLSPPEEGFDPKTFLFHNHISNV